MSRFARTSVVVAAATVQAAALATWLSLARSYRPGSSEALLGVVALASGLFLGCLLAAAAAGGVGPRSPLAPAVSLAVAEAALLVGWYALVGRLSAVVGDAAGLLVASAALAALLVPLRTAELRLFRGEALLDDVADPDAAVSGGVDAASVAVLLGLVLYGQALFDAVGVGRVGFGGVVAVTAGPAADAGALAAGAVAGIVALAVLRLAGRLLVVSRAAD